MLAQESQYVKTQEGLLSPQQGKCIAKIVCTESHCMEMQRRVFASLISV